MRVTKFIRVTQMIILAPAFLSRQMPIAGDERSVDGDERLALAGDYVALAHEMLTRINTLKSGLQTSEAIA